MCPENSDDALYLIFIGIFCLAALYWKHKANRTLRFKNREGRTVLVFYDELAGGYVMACQGGVYIEEGK